MTEWMSEWISPAMLNSHDSCSDDDGEPCWGDTVSKTALPGHLTGRFNEWWMGIKMQTFLKTYLKPFSLPFIANCGSGDRGCARGSGSTVTQIYKTARLMCDWQKECVCIFLSAGYILYVFNIPDVKEMVCSFCSLGNLKNGIQHLNYNNEKIHLNILSRDFVHVHLFFCVSVWQFL